MPRLSEGARDTTEANTVSQGAAGSLGSTGTSATPESGAAPEAAVASRAGFAGAPLTRGRILRLWWPLAASWLLMGAELPLFTAFVARMPDAEVNLAAYGSLVFPIALIIEAPIIMLLAASTALSRDRTSYRKLMRFVTASGATLTALHVLVAATPLFTFLAERVLRVPPEVVEPGRIGLLIMTPWTWAIADRRFHQGVLIRFERSRSVSLGTLVRLLANLLVLTIGLSVGAWSGIVVGTSAVAVGVTAEALFVRWCATPVVRSMPAELPGTPLTRRSFLRFYVPLAMTPLLALLNQPLGAAAMSRMPNALLSLAAWPPVHGLVFLPRSAGFAFNEVVVSLLGERGAVRALRRFTLGLACATSGVLLVVAASPLAGLWFQDVSGLDSRLAQTCGTALFVACLLPALQALQSWYQGVLVHARRTRGITESVLVYLVVAAAALVIGILWSGPDGIHVALFAFTLGAVVQTLWLARRSRRKIEGLSEDRTP